MAITAVIAWDQVSNWTAVTFLGIAFLLLMQWVVKNMTAEFKQLRAEHRALQSMMMENFRLLITHDAQIRGVNPTAGQDMTETHQRALEVLQKTLASCDAIASSLSSK